MDEPVELGYHYRVIERALAEIEREGRDLTLEDLAARMGMSAGHFQRLFSAWVGVSPKRYQQYLSLDLAKHMLREQVPVMEVSAELGLSAPSRLYDMFLTWEAMSPGDYAKGGAGLTIGHALIETPFGQAVAMATPRGLCGLSFVGPDGAEAAFQDLSRRWPKAAFRPEAQVADLALSALAGQGTRLHLMGAPFQVKVWEALLALPEGRVTSYSKIAKAIGSPKAVRAVGSAIGRNPIGLLIPCHRALRLNGDLGGYHWGLTRKRAILAYEAARRDAISDPAQGVMP